MTGTALESRRLDGLGVLGRPLLRGSRRRAAIAYALIVGVVLVGLWMTWPDDGWDSSDAVLAVSVTVAYLAVWRFPVASVVVGDDDADDPYMRISLFASLHGLVGLAGDARVGVAIFIALEVIYLAIDAVMRRRRTEPRPWSPRKGTVRLGCRLAVNLLRPVALLFTVDLVADRGASVFLASVIACGVVCEAIQQLLLDSTDLINGRQPATAPLRDAIWMSALFFVPPLVLVPVVAVGGSAAIVLAVFLCAVWSVELSLLCGAFLERSARFEEQRQLARVADDRGRRVLDRIATQIHDGPLQVLYSQRFALESINVESPEDAERMDEVLGRLSGAAEELRTIAGGLSIRTPADRGMEAALEEEAALFVPALPDGVRCVVRCQCSPSTDTVAVIAGIVHEALRNVVRHAQARRADVIVTADHPSIEVLVCDNGVGFDSLGDRLDSMGLSLMERSVTRLGGRLEVSSSDAGTRVHARIPLELPPARHPRLSVHEADDRTVEPARS